MPKIKVSKEEEEYIIKEIAQRIFEIHTFLGHVEVAVNRLGGIQKIVNDNPLNTYIIKLDTELVSGDFMQILQRYRGINNADKKETI